MTAERPVSLIVLTISLALLWLPTAAVAQKSPRGKTLVSTDQFTLHSRNEQYSLFLRPSTKSQSIPLKTEWLKPPETPEEQDANSGIPFSTTLYSQRVTSFPIGNGEIGLQLSSFDMMTEGSMMGAGGRDVFLILNPSAHSLRPGLIDLGVTKERSRGDGCFSALMTHFVLADANDDGNIDIGVIREEIKCPVDEDWPNPPSYVQHMLHWYLFGPQGWKKTEEEDLGWPDDYTELPLIEMYLSPVDFVGALLWGTHDPAKWTTPPAFTPGYRKRLIQQDKRRTPSTPSGKGKSNRPPLTPEIPLPQQHQ